MRSQILATGIADERELDEVDRACVSTSMTQERW